MMTKSMVSRRSCPSPLHQHSKFGCIGPYSRSNETNGIMGSQERLEAIFFTYRSSHLPLVVVFLNFAGACGRRAGSRDAATRVLLLLASTQR